MSDLLFYIDILGAADNKLGPGPITSATDWTYTGRMDKAGDWSFVMPASDPLAQFVQKKRQIRAYAALSNGTWTEVGAGIIDNIERQPQRDGTVLLTVSGGDLLRELTYRSVKDLKLYFDNDPVSPATALSAVAAYAPAGWTFTPDASPPNPSIYGRFNGESVLAALVKIADKAYSHFYRAGGRQVVFTHTFSASGLRAIQAGPGDLVAETCAITQLVETVDTYDLATRIYPRGSGNGDVPVTLKATTRTAPTGYTLDKSENYLQHDAAVATYGIIEDFVDWREIGPIENTTSDVRAAADMLFDEALRELQRRSQEIETPYYALDLAGCAALLRPMQTIHVVYRDDLAGLDVDEHLRILEATWQVGADGVQTTRLLVTSADRWPQNEAQAIADGLTQGKIYQALPQLSANEYVTGFTKNVDGDNDATFRFRFSRAVTALRWAFFEFQILPFESTVKSVGTTSTSTGAGGGTTATSTSGGSSTPTTSSGGASAPTTSAGGSSTPTTSNGGGATVTSASGGSSNPTTSDGGGTTETSTNSGQNHIHTVGLSSGSIGNTVLYNSGIGGFVTSGGGEVETDIGSADHDHDVTIPDHSHTVTIPSHDHSVTILDHSHTVTISNHQHTVTIPSHQHTVTISGHTHDVTIPNHTHSILPAIETVYGIFRESPANTYDMDHLEYRVNSGAWAALSGAENLGDGWHRLDITAAIQDADTLLPLTDSNRVEVRANAAYAIASIGGLGGVVTNIVVADTSLFAVGNTVEVTGTANQNGTYTITDIVSGVTMSLEPGSMALEETTGTVTLMRTATIDAQLSVHTTIQPIYQ